MKKLKILLMSIAKRFVPSGATLAEYAAAKIAKAANDSDVAVKSRVAKYATLAESATAIANKLSAMAADGTIDKAEESELAEILTPVMERVVELI